MILISSWRLDGDVDMPSGIYGAQPTSGRRVDYSLNGLTPVAAKARRTKILESFSQA